MKYLIIIFALVSTFASADTVGLQFRQIKIPDLIETISKNIIHRDYVLSPEVASISSTVSLDVKRIDRSEVLDLLTKTLASEFVVINENSGILYITKSLKLPDSVSVSAPAAERQDRNIPEAKILEIFSYHPRYRSSEILTLALKAAGADVPEIKEGKRDFVVFTCPPDRVSRYVSLLQKIDIPSPSIFVKAALLEVTKSSESNQSFGAVISLLNGKLGVSINPAQNYNHALTFAGATIQAVLSAVQGDSRFKFLAEPQLKVLDGEMARLVVGQDVPIKGQTIISQNQTTQGIEYRTAGLVIELEPRIMREVINLRIKQSMSDVMQTTTSGIDSPTMQKRESQTVVSARDGELILIAGLDTDRETQSNSGLSFLPSFLSSKSGNKTSSQMLLLLEVHKEVFPELPI